MMNSDKCGRDKNRSMYNKDISRAVCAKRVYRSHDESCPNGGYIYSGTGQPSNNVGRNCDFYIDVTNALIYGPKKNGVWNNDPIQLKGIRGIDGANGTSGTSANGFLYGPDPPDENTESNIGDFYIQIIDDDEGQTTLILYGPKTDGVDPWGQGIEISGQPTLILSGDEEPTDEQGKLGDFYIWYDPPIEPDGLPQTYIYGPKDYINGWGNGVLLTGVTGNPGNPGENGENGNLILVGSDPEGKGEDGDYYIQLIDDGEGGIQQVLWYGPKFEDAWPSPVSLTGLPGFPGKNGENANKVIFGVEEPAPETGFPGDFYVIEGEAIYGPKKDGDEWALVRILSGQDGINGTDTNIIMVGTESPPETDIPFGTFYYQYDEFGEGSNNLYGPYGEEGWPGPFNLDGKNGVPELLIQGGAEDVLLQTNINQDELIGTDVRVVTANFAFATKDIFDVSYPKIPIAMSGLYIAYFSTTEYNTIVRNLDTLEEYEIPSTFKCLALCLEYPLLGEIRLDSIFPIEGEGEFYVGYHIFSYLLNSNGTSTLLFNNSHLITAFNVEKSLRLPCINFSPNKNYFAYQYHNYPNVDYQFYEIETDNTFTLLNSSSVPDTERYMYDNLHISNNGYLFTSELDTENNNYYITTRLYGNDSTKNTTTFSAYPNYLPVIVGDYLVITPIGNDLIYIFDISTFNPATSYSPIVTSYVNYEFTIGHSNGNFLSLTSYDSVFGNGIDVYSFDLSDPANINNPIFVESPSPAGIVQTVSGGNTIAYAATTRVLDIIRRPNVPPYTKRMVFGQSSDGTVTSISRTGYPNTGITASNTPNTIDFYVDGTLVANVTPSGMANVSDPKFKKNMQSLTDGLDILSTVDSYKFSFKHENDDMIHYGYNARELLDKYTNRYGVEERKFGAIGKLDDTLYVSYNDFVSVNISAIKQLKQKNTELDNLIAQLESKLEFLQS